MSLSTQPYKGTRDFYPEDKRKQKYMFDVLARVAESFGYIEYDGPTLELLELYTAKTSEEIVNNQTYSFTDRGDRRIVMRPEMTPTVSRMVAARRQELAYPLRLYSIDNFFRYERSQRGRLREFWQLNADLFGVEGIEGDFEIIQLADAMLQAFGANPSSYSIRINSRKAAEAFQSDLKMSSDQSKMVASLLDKRSKMSEEEFDEQLNQAVGEKLASELKSYWSSEEPPDNVVKLLNLLSKAGVQSATFDPEVVRGFDYYTDIVFEVFDKNAENNRSMFGGGRYDGLVAEFGVEPLPTVGFALGDVTLQNFLESNGLMPKLMTETDATVILIGGVFETVQPLLAELRREGLNLAVDATDRKVDAKIKSAAKSGVESAIFIGEQEIKDGKFKLKNLQSGDERSLSIVEIIKELAKA